MGFFNNVQNILIAAFLTASIIEAGVIVLLLVLR